MSHEELIQVLKICPASDYFGQLRVKLNRHTVSLNKARQLVIQMIRKVKRELVEAIPEQMSERERSSQGGDDNSERDHYNRATIRRVNDAQIGEVKAIVFSSLEPARQREDERDNETEQAAAFV